MKIDEKVLAGFADGSMPSGLLVKSLSRELLAARRVVEAARCGDDDRSEVALALEAYDKVTERGPALAVGVDRTSEP